ncbi:methyl-CpG-binding domain protein 2 [Crocuta crocuta]
MSGPALDLLNPNMPVKRISWMIDMHMKIFIEPSRVRRRELGRTCLAPSKTFSVIASIKMCSSTCQYMTNVNEDYILNVGGAFSEQWKRPAATVNSLAGMLSLKLQIKAGGGRKGGAGGGAGGGKSDVYYFSPSGKKFRSKPQLARYLGNTVDLSSFDFRTGKMMPSKLQKNKQRLRNDPLNQNKGKPDLNTTLPIRQTASIFKQPVTKVTNHPSNKVKSDPQRMNEQPRQLFWEKRLQGLSASDVTEQIIKTMELPKGLQGVGPGSNDETLLSAVASALHTSSAPITGQVSPAVEKNPAVWLNTSQPLCKAFIVTDEDIRKQEERVQQVRKKLEEALMADILSRAADTEEMDIEMDSGDEA